MAEVANRKVAIDLNIRSAYIKLEDPMEVYIEWQRGEKHIDTKAKDIDPTINIATFNEKFQMKTGLDYDVATKQFLPKKSVLALFRKKDKKLLEEIQSLEGLSLRKRNKHSKERLTRFNSSC